MKIKSILVEVEDDSGKIKKVLLNDFKNIREDSVEIHTETNDYMKLRPNGDMYTSNSISQHYIDIRLKCTEYALMEMKGE